MTPPQTTPHGSEHVLVHDEDLITNGPNGEETSTRLELGGGSRPGDGTTPKAPLKEQGSKAYIRSLEDRINKKDEIIVAIQEVLLRLKA